MADLVTAGALSSLASLREVATQGPATTKPRQLPTGTVTFLFTDIEGSTRLLQYLGDDYAAALEEHAVIVRQAVAAAGGIEVSTEGDSFFVVFAEAPAAVAAAVGAQQQLSGHEWPRESDLRVRMGLHTGEGRLGGDNYAGAAVHRAARIAEAAHGGQILMSATTAALVDKQLPAGTVLRDLGEHLLKDLVEPEHLFHAVITGLADRFPPIRSRGAPPAHLPSVPTSFVGREDDLAEALELFESTRLLTLTGPGGTGKTRLSIQMATQLAPEFADGAYFVPLATISDPALVPTQILEALGLRASAAGLSPHDHLLDYLGDRSVLLVLDNLEQLPGAAPLIAELLTYARDCRIIVTSRSPLHVSGEQEMEVPPLDVPDPERVPAVDELLVYEAVRLFADRAAAVRPGFAVDAGNAAAVATLTERLDGLPLAIELAASRVKLLAPAAILDRLDARMLSGGPRDVPARQQTVWNAIGWSYELLADPSRRLFNRAAAFAGGRLAEIEAVCAPGLDIDVLDGLALLIDQSLVRRVERESGERYVMLHVIREFAAERLAESGEEREIRGRHAAAYLDLAEKAARELTRPNRAQWLRRLATDHDNIRAAIEWYTVERDADRALRLTASLWRFFQMRGHLHEGRRRLAAALELQGADPELQAKALEAMGGIAYWQGDLEAAHDIYSQVLDQRRQMGGPAAIAAALYNLSLPIAFLGDYERSMELLEEAERIYAAADDVGGLADVYWGMGNAKVYNGMAAPARDLFEQAAAGYERVDNTFGLGWALFELANCSIRLGDRAEAESQLRRGINLFLDAEDVSAVVLYLLGFGAVAYQAGDKQRAYRLAGAAVANAEKRGVGLLMTDINRYPGLEPETLADLEGRQADAFDSGLQLDVEGAIALALEG